jgi:putative ABC transport system permease protein
VFGLQLLSVRERRAEIGIRRALGGTRGDLFLQFTVESLLVTTAGAIGGAFIATLYWRVQHASAAVPITVGAAVSCLVAGALASVPPTRQAAGLPPAVAMRIS